MNKKIKKIMIRLTAVFLAILVAAGIVLSQSSDRVLRATALPDDVQAMALGSDTLDESLSMENEVIKLPAAEDAPEEEPQGEQDSEENISGPEGNGDDGVQEGQPESEGEPENGSEEDSAENNEPTIVEVSSEDGAEGEESSESEETRESSSEETPETESSQTQETVSEETTAPEESTEEESSEEESSAPEEPQEVIYTVIFEDYDGSEILKREVPENEELEVLPMDPFRNGYAFLRWEDEDGEEVTEETVITEDMTVTAVYEFIDIYTITVDYFYYDAAGNYHNIDKTVVTVDSRTVTDEAPVQIESPPQYQIRDDGGVLAGEIYYPASQTIRIYPQDLDDASETKTIERSVEYSTQAVGYSCVYMLKDLTGEGYSEIERIEGHAVIGSLVTPEIRNYSYAVFERTEPYQITGDGEELYVYYTRKNYTLIFDSLGGTAVNPQVLPYGSHVSLAGITPERNGYDFSGWYTDEGLNNKVNIVNLDTNVTLYAGWKAKTVGYTIVYMKEKYDNETGGTYYVYDNSRSASTVVGTVIKADDRSIPKLTSNINGYEADTVRNAASQVRVAADGSSVLTVYYSLIRYTIVFNIYNSNGRIVMGGQTYTGSNYRISNIVLGQDISSMWPSSSNEIYSTKSRNYFSGWTGAGSTYITRRYEVIWDNVSRANSSHVMTFTASWSSSSASRNAEYWLQQPDGTYKVEDEFTQIGINTTNLGAKDLDGYSKHSGTPAGYSGSGYSGSTYVYRFYYDRNSYGIEYYDGGTRLSSKSNILFGTDISGSYYNYVPQAPAGEEDYTWGGWFTDSALSKAFSFTTMPGNNVALYANWIPPQYSVVFHNNYDGAEDILSEQSVSRNATAEDPGIPVRANYRFTGWFTRSEGGRQYLAGSEPVTDDIDLYAHWEIIPLKYTVRYIDHTSGKTLFTSKTVENPSFIPGQQITEEAAVIAGYIPYDSRKTISLSFDPAQNEIVFEYETKSDRKLKYTVQYVLLEDPEIHVAEDKQREVAGTYASITETAAAVTDARYSGYRPTAVSGTLQLGLNSSSNILTFYYIPDGAGVTVNWLDMDGNVIPGKEPAVSHYKVGSHFNVSTVLTGYKLHHITDTADGDGSGSYYVYGNYDISINVYMQKLLTVTAAGKSKTYDGTPLENSGVGDVTVSGLETGHSLESVEFIGSQTNAGTSQSVPQNAVISGPQSEDYYEIIYIAAPLVVSKVAVTINIEPDRWNDGPAYDGTARTIGFRNLRNNPDGTDGVGFTNAVYEEKYGKMIRDMVRDITFTASDAGTYRIAAADIISAIELPEDGNYDVVLNVRDGELTIAPADLTIHTGSAERVYNGNALTNDEVWYEGLAAGDLIEVTATGSQTAAGSSENTFTINWGDTSENNYNVISDLGTLKVTDREVKYEITLEPNGGEELYDGTEKTVSGFKTLDFTLEGNTYTVSGVTAEASGINADEYLVETDGEPVVNDSAGNDVTKQFSVHIAQAKLVIRKRNVTLTSATVSREYNGSPLSSEEVTVSGDGFVEGEGAVYDVTGSQTLAGSSPNTFTYGLMPGTLESNYNITMVPGTLSVTNRGAKYKITVSAMDASFKYDGAEHESYALSGLEQVIEGHTYTVTGLSAYGAGTHAGSYSIDILGTPVVSDESGNDVSGQFAVECENGTLSIIPRSVTITSADAGKPYDGTALTGNDAAQDKYLIEGDGFADGEGAEITFTGTRTLPGTGENSFTYILNGNTVADDYVITTAFGTLTVLDRNESEKYAITVKANGGTFLYDGEAHSVEGLTGTEATFNGIRYTVEGLSASYEAVNSGTYEVAVTGTALVRDPDGADVTEQFSVNLVPGELNITKRSVILTSATASKEYDGTALTAGTVNVTGDGFAAGEGAAFEVTGSRILAGSSENAFSYTLNEGTDAANYDIEVRTGSLTVNPRSVKYSIRVEANSASFLYDGTEHKVNGLRNVRFTVDGNEYTVEGLSAEASGSAAGEYTAFVTGTAIIRDSEGNDVTAEFNVERASGSLNVAKRKVTLTSDSEVKTYDGTELTLKGSEDGRIVSSGDGFAAGEGVDLVFTAGQTLPGSCENTFTYSAQEGTSLDNYIIEPVFGKLTVTGRGEGEKFPVTVESASAEFPYDGTEHTVSGLVVETITVNGQTYTIEGVDAGVSGTHAGEYTNEISGTVIIRDSAGNDITDQFDITIKPGKLTINKRSLIFTSESLEREYNGTALTGSNVSITGDGFAEGEGASFNVTGSQLNAGSSENSFTYELDQGTQAGDYNIASVFGSLKVLDRSVRYEVTVHAAGGEYLYDGYAHAADGIYLDGNSEENAVSGSISFEQDGNRYVLSGLSAGSEATAAGNYSVNVEGNAQVTDAFGNDVTRQFSVNTVSAQLIINKRNVTLKSQSTSKEYDGNVLTAGEVTAGGDGFASGEGASFIVTGSQLTPGSSENAFTYTLNEGTAAGNYNISQSFGTLTVVNRQTRYTITAKAKDAEYLYDGTAHRVSGFITNEFEIDGNRYYLSGLLAEAEGTHAGSYTATVTGEPKVSDAEGNDVTDQFAVFTEAGNLNIRKRSVRIESFNAEKTYDGGALTGYGAQAPGYRITGDGFADGEGAAITFTGTRTLPGESENSFSYILTGQTEAGDYDIATSFGKLNIRDRSEGERYLIRVKANSASFQYDGAEHAAGGFEQESFVIGGNEYTVEGLTAEVSATDAGSYPVIISGTALVKDSDGNDVTSQFKVETEEGLLTIEKRNITFTSQSVTREYDGTELRAGLITVTGDGFAEGEGAEFTVTGSQLISGSSTNMFSYVLNGNTKADNYNIVKEEGTLTVLPRTVKYVITVKANDGSFVYDGQEHTVSGLEREAFTVGGNEYTVSGLIASGSATDAGEYAVSVTGTAKVTDSEGNDVTSEFAVEKAAGSMKVEKRHVTLTSASAAKTYDGTELTMKGSEESAVSVTGDGFAEGEGVDITLTGSQTVPGESSNTFTYAAQAGTDPDNYVIETRFGTLTVTGRGADKKFPVTVESAGAEFPYDGTEHTVSGLVAETFTVNGQTYTIEGVKTGVSATHAGEYTNEISGTVIIRDSEGNDVTDQFDITIRPGKLTISKRSLVFTSESLEREYNGTALTGSYVSITGDGFAEGEGVTFNVTGSQLTAGSSKNIFTYVLNQGTEAGDYNIGTTFGTLTVLDRSVRYEVTVRAAGGEYLYDGNTHAADGIYLDGTGAETAVNGDISFEQDGNRYVLSGLSAQSEAAAAGSYDVNVEGTAQITDALGNDVTDQFAVNTVNAKLIINKRSVTLTSQSASKEYDGNVLTAGEVAAGGDGFAAGEGAAYNVTGSQLTAGSSENTFTYTLNNGTDADNYIISQNYGTLTVLNREAQYRITAQASSGEFLYDGTLHEVSGFVTTDFTVEGNRYYLSGLRAEAEGTHAGSYTAAVTGVPVVSDSRGNDVTAQFAVETIPGTLVITKRSVTITSSDAEKTYDGRALTGSYAQAPGYVITGDGFADGEGAAVNFTGTRTLPGTAENSFTYALTGNTEAEDYNITTAFGTLRVLDRGESDKYSITVKANSRTFVYNGEEHTVSGLEREIFTVDGNEYTVSGLSASASATDAGSYPVYVTGTPKVSDAAGNDVTSQFFITEEDGELEISRARLEISALSTEKKYDGSASFAGVTGTIPEGAVITYSTDGRETWVYSAPKQTSAGVLEYAVRVEDPNHEPAYATGTIRIDKRNVILTSASDQKEYDGTELINHQIIYSGDAFVEGEGVVINNTGSQTLPGSGSNTFTYEFMEGTDPGNYEITVMFGSLNIINREARYQITVSAKNHTVKYDGTSKTVSGLESETFTVNGNVYTVEGMQAEVTAVNAGEYDIPVTGTPVVKDASGNIVTDQFAVQVSSGKLTVEQRKIILSSPSASKEYDGTDLTTAAAVEVSGEGFVGDDGVDIVMTGRQLLTGTSDNTFTYVFKEGTDGRNYEITPSFGKLTVTSRGSDDLFKITVEAAGGEAVYDGTEHETRGIIRTEFEINGVIYTVEGIDAQVKGTDAGSYTSTVTGTPVVRDSNGNDVTDQFSIVPVDAELVIARRNVTLTSASMSREFDGTPLTSEDVTVGGDGFAEGEGAVFEVTGSQLTAGSSSNTFTYALTAQTKPENYIISVHPGILTVTNREAKYEITVEANSGDGKYDGSTWHVEGFVNETYEAGGNLYTVEGLSASVSAKDAGTYPVMVSGTPVVRDAGGNDVTEEFIVNTRDGVLDIARRKITFTSDSASREYNGNVLSAENVTVSGEGFVEGEGAEFSFSEGITTVGFARNYFSWTMKEGTRAENYEVTVNEGELTVYNRSARYEIEVVPNSAEYLYDGQIHSAEGLVTTRFGIGDNIYTVEGLDAARSEIHAGEYPVGVTGTAVVRDASGNDVTDQFRVITREGTLRISPRHVTLTSGTAEKTYNGFLLTDDTVEVSGDGFAAGEGVSVSVTGRQMLPGASENIFSYVFYDGTEATDYVVSTAFGMLTVVNRSEGELYEIAVGAPDEEFLYDGNAHSAGGLFIIGSDGEEAAQEGPVEFLMEGNTYTLSGMQAYTEAVNAGNYPVNITGTAVITDSEGNDVSAQFAVHTVPGRLVINRRQIILTSDSAEHPYTGRQVTGDNVTIGGDGFAEGEGAVFEVTGTRTIVGTGENEFTYILNDGTNADNYDITTVFGTLTVTNRDAKYTVALTANSGEFMYDGTEKHISGFRSSSFTLDGAEYRVTGLEAEARGILPGEYDVRISGQPVVLDSEGNDVTAQFAVTVNKGTLKIRVASSPVAPEEGERTVTVDFVNEEGEKVADSFEVVITPEEELGPVAAPEVPQMAPEYDYIVIPVAELPDQDVQIQVIYTPVSSVDDLPEPGAVPEEQETLIYDEPVKTAEVTVNGSTGEVTLNDISDEEVPLAAPARAGYWALLNLLLAVCTVFIMILLIVIYFAGRKHSKDEEKEENTEKSVAQNEDTGYNSGDAKKHRRWIWAVLSIIPAVGSVIAFLLTEDMTNSMRIVDIWTILMAVIFLIQVALLVLNRRKKEDEEEEGSEENA